MSQHVLLREIESANRRKDIPDFRSGDSVRVHTLIKEGDKERVQVFEGVVIGQHRGGSRASFTVRKISYGVGVERIFPLHTSRIEKIEVVTRGRVRRARLNYLRDLQGKAARRAEDLAAAHLERAGMRVVARNWRRPEGELDIVADDAGTCVFVEVRSRTGTALGHPLEAITPSKRAQVIRTARLYLDAEPREAAGYRFDVVAVTFDPEGLTEPELVHLPNAFEVG
jgi:large subunit ribosomal protein L19